VPSRFCSNACSCCNRPDDYYFHTMHPNYSYRFSIWLVSPDLTNHDLVLLEIFTNSNMIGTSTNTPTTVAKVAPDCRPKSEIATATASSKKLLAPIIPAGEAIS